MAHPRELLRAAAIAAATLLSLAVALPAHAAPCDGFTDVDSAVSFCKSIEWLKNRQVTSGCTGLTYCPSQPVTRAQMAIFMNRLGKALTTQRLVVDQAPGALVLPAVDPAHMCETSTVTASGYPRLATLRGVVTGLGNANVAAWRATLLVSTDGTTWTEVPGTIHATALAANWSYAAPIVTYALDATASLRVAIGVRRDDVVAGTTGDFADSRCQLVVEIDNANGTVSPFDVADQGGVL